MRRNFSHHCLSSVPSRNILQIWLLYQTGRPPERLKLAADQPGGVHTLRTWSPPQQGYMKLMVDAAISRHGNRGAVAVVCRGAQGIYQGSSAVIFQDMVQPECLEAMAVSEALALASDLYIDKILVATDCMSTVNHLKGQYLGPNAAIIHDIKEKMGEFAGAEIIHVRREKNWEAHDLAKSVGSFEVGRHVWLLASPDFL